jgi:hypothetical protein
MASSDVQATIVLNGGYQGGTEPWAQAVTLRLNGDGFLDVDGVGREGDVPGPLDLVTLADSLAASFDRVGLAELFDQLDLLRTALARP